LSTYGTVTMLSDAIPPLRTRKPDGKVRWPVIALTGPEHSGKSTTIVHFSRDQRLAGMYVAEWGAGDNGVLNEYGVMPGARFELLEHNNSVQSVFGQVLAAREVARKSIAEGGKPYALAIDSWSTCWDLIKDWTSLRAAHAMLRANQSNPAAGPIDPNATVTVGRNLWNDARDRYRQFMTVLLTWPGPVILTCRARWVSGTDEKTGQPSKQREYSIDCHNSLVSDATVVIRMNRGAPPELHKCRSIHLQLDPKRATPMELPGDHLDLGGLLYDRMQLDPANAVVPDAQDRLDDIPDTVEGHVIGSGRPPAEPPAPQRQRPQPSEPFMRGIDWDAQLANAVEVSAATGGYGGVRKRLSNLWNAAKLGGAPDEFADKLGAAGRHAMWMERLTTADPADVDEILNEAFASPDVDHNTLQTEFDAWAAAGGVQ
jgi:hypothetical protein